MKWLVLVLFLLASPKGVAKAQSTPISFTYTVYNSGNTGLSHNTVTNLMMDSNGFLWVCTIDGLNRFDGKAVKTFQHNPQDNSSLSDSFIHGMIEDAQGRIWIGTRDGGIDVFHPETATFSSLSDYTGKEKIIPNAPVYMFVKESAGHFWASIGGEAFGLLSPDSARYHKAAVKNIQTGEQLHSPNAILLFNDESLFGASFSGLYYIPPAEMKSYRSNLDKGVIRAHHIPLPQRAGVQNLSKIIMDSEQNIWVYDENSGLIKIPNSALSQQMASSLSSGVKLEPNRNHFLETEHYIVSAAGERGLEFLQKSTGEKTYQPIIVNSKQFSSKSLYRDPKGDIWARSWGDGFLRLHEQSAIKRISTETHPKMKTDFMLAFEEEPERGIWFGGGRGLGFWDIRRQRMTYWPKLAKIFDDKKIWSLERDLNGGGLWVVTVTSGLFYVPLNEQGEPIEQFQKFTAENHFLKSYHLHQVFTDSRGWLWVGYEGDGLQLIKNPQALVNGQPASIVEYSARAGTADKNKIGGDKIRRIYEDRNGDIWLATMQNGFTRIKIQDNQPTEISVWRHQPGNPNSISLNDGRSIYHQNDSTYWFATYGGGITRWHTNTNTFLRLRTEQGLPNNSTYGILPDPNGLHIWISTNNGLARLHTGTLDFSIYKEDDNIQNKEFNTGAFLSLISGSLVFGGISGFNIIRSKKLSVNTRKPPVYITQIKLFNKPYKADTSSIYKKKLVLDYTQNFLSFEFIALDYENPRQNQYAYKMAGIDKDWVEPGNRNFADYPNLEPGKYLFKVKAANNDGIWNERGTQLAITITPPWWQTAWFRFTTGLLLLGGLIAGVRYISQRTLRKKLRKMELERKLQGERERISRDLHDHVGSQLANIISGISLMEKYDETDNRKRKAELMQSLRSDAGVTIKQLRETIWALNQNSLTIDKFIEHLKSYFQSQSAIREKLHIRYHYTYHKHRQHGSKAEGDVHFSSTQALNVFRIIQEAAQNTLKHAGAENLAIHFEQKNGNMVVSIKDDGQFKGAHPSSFNAGYGMGNIRKRAEELEADLQIKTHGGTEIKITLPA